MKLSEIAGHLGCELIGDGGLSITGLKSIESAKQGELTFAAESKYIHRVNESEASAIIVTEELSKELSGKNLLVSKNPYFSFTKLLNIFYKQDVKPPGIDKNVVIAHNVLMSESASIYPNVFIDEGAVIKDNVVIYPGCFIGKNVTIGRNTVIYPNVVVREDCSIGDNVIIHAGSIIGSDGFGYVLNEGEQVKIPQVGRVVIEDNVEIGANVTIDKAALGETVIGEGTKIDNLVMIAHNVKIGRHCVIIGQAGIAGSTKLGDAVTMAAQSGTVGHIKIGNGVVVAARGGVTHHLKDGERVAGFPAVDAGKWRKAMVLTGKLPELRKKVMELEKRLKELEDK
jgi:UDP-3-O-[3-hydroxymyristoyl] glucosamine N-acyltransferase